MNFINIQGIIPPPRGAGGVKKGVTKDRRQKTARQNIKDMDIITFE